MHLSTIGGNSDQSTQPPQLNYVQASAPSAMAQPGRPLQTQALITTLNKGWIQAPLHKA